MVKDLHIRDIDAKIHSQLGEAADQLGISVNSVVKDAIDKWLKTQSQIPKKHDLVLYADDNSMIHLLKSMDRITKEANLFKTFCGPPAYKAVKLLKKLNWFDATVHPYNSRAKNFEHYYAQVVEKIIKGSKKKPICLFDFIIEDISKSSLKEAIKLEAMFDKNRLHGMTFCPYRTNTVISAEIEDMMELFSHHDRIFILKEEEVYKLHVTTESVHKLFLN